MPDREQLEEIKELVKKIESILCDEWQQQELTNLIESFYYDGRINWLINLVERLEKQNKRYREAIERALDESGWGDEGNALAKAINILAKALEESE